MSNEKKLKEYLRNNKKALNLNSSANLQNNAQISKKPKRNYDENPIIIKDNSLYLFLFSGLLAGFLVFITWDLFSRRQSFAH